MRDCIISGGMDEKTIYTLNVGFTGKVFDAGEGGGGLALEIESFVGPCEIARADDRRVLFGPVK